MLSKGQSSSNKLISFFEDAGVIQVQEKTIKGRAVKSPRVEYDRIEFKLDAA